MAAMSQKVVLITGAGSGIGKATAKLFAEEGAMVIATDINASLGQAVADEIGSHAIYLNLDVSQEPHWQHIMSEVKQRYGKLDALINNAGISGFASGCGQLDPEHASLDDWRLVHAVNLDGVFLGCKHAIKLMKAQISGAIVNISSRMGIVALPGNAAYSASKAAVRNLTKSVALYCAQQKYPIRCNSIHPGAILTPLWNPWLGDEGEARQKLISEVEKGIPVGKMGTPEDVAKAILFLASDDASYITGTELIVDGGIQAGSIAPIQ